MGEQTEQWAFKRRGSDDLTLRRVDPEERCAFHDLSSFGPLSSGQDWGYALQSIYERFLHVDTLEDMTEWSIRRTEDRRLSRRDAVVQHMAAFKNMEKNVHGAHEHRRKERRTCWYLWSI